MKAWIGAIAVAGMLVSGVALADGNVLLTECQAVVRGLDNRSARESLYDQGKCIGIVETVLKMTMYRNSKLPAEYRVCFPKGGVTNGQGARIVVKWLQENPALLSEDNVLLAMSAFGDAYPCKG